MTRLSSILLRLALAFSFLYVGYGFWKDPMDWVGYVPAFVQNIGGVSQEILLLGIAGFHVLFALWILSGLKVRLSSLVAATFLGGVVYFNLNQLDILFRDISLALVALALTFNSDR